MSLSYSLPVLYVTHQLAPNLSSELKKSTCKILGSVKTLLQMSLCPARAVSGSAQEVLQALLPLKVTAWVPRQQQALGPCFPQSKKHSTTLAAETVTAQTQVFPFCDKTWESCDVLG